MICIINIITVNCKERKGRNAKKHLTHVTCVQKHRLYQENENLKYHEVSKGWTLFISLEWKNSMNATIGGVGVLLNSYAMKSLNIIEKTISNIKDYIRLKDNITLLPLTPQAERKLAKLKTYRKKFHL